MGKTTEVHRRSEVSSIETYQHGDSPNELQYRAEDWRTADDLVFERLGPMLVGL
jgi:hypothetical protein